MMMGTAARWILLSATLWIGGCCSTAAVRSGTATRLDEGAYPWTLRPPSAYATDVMWRQRVEARFRGGSQAFDAVLQKKGDALTLVGLTPMGTKAFVIQQDGSAVTATSFIDRELPFPPRFIVIDIQRTYFPLGPAAADGAVVSEIDGERVTEIWEGGILRKRTFERLDGRPAGAVTVRYDDWQAGVPREVVLTQAWFGYELTIETLEARAL